MKHVISLLVDNEPSVLSRVAGLFSGRGFNIESLNVAETLDPTVSRMTLVTFGNDQIIEQIIKQLNKLINAIKVVDLTGSDYVDREMALIKVNAKAASRAEVLRIVLEITGNDRKIQAVIDLLSPIGIMEIVRTGKVAIARHKKTGSKTEKEQEENSE